MAKVQNVKLTTPSEEIIQAQNQEFVVTDKRGRKITLKKPGILMQYKLVEILGDSSSNQRYLAMVMPLLFVTSIDNLPVHRLADKRQIDALLERLDEDGLSAVMEGVNENFNAAKTDEEYKEVIKK